MLYLHGFAANFACAKKKSGIGFRDRLGTETCFQFVSVQNLSLKLAFAS